MLMGGRWELPPGRLGLIGSRDDLAGIEQTSWIEEPLDFTTNLQLCRKVLGKETGTGEAEPLFTTQGAIEPHDRRHEVGRQSLEPLAFAVAAGVGKGSHMQLAMSGMSVQQRRGGVSFEYLLVANQKCWKLGRWNDHILHELHGPDSSPDAMQRRDNGPRQLPEQFDIGGHLGPPHIDAMKTRSPHQIDGIIELLLTAGLIVTGKLHQQSRLGDRRDKPFEGCRC